MNILFINGSPNKNGNTAALAAELLAGKDYKTLMLTDGRVFHILLLLVDRRNHFRVLLQQLRSAGIVALVLVHCGDLCHFIGSQLKIEQIKV